MNAAGIEMYKMQKMSNPEERLNKPVEVVEIYTDNEMDDKKVYRQITPGEKKKIEAAKAAAKAAREREIRENADIKAPTAVKANAPTNAPTNAPNNAPNNANAKPAAVKPRGVVSSSTPVPVPINVPPPPPPPVTPTPPPPPADDTVNFYWVRHAESVANLYNNKPTDKYKEDLQEPLKNEIRRFLKQDYDNVQKMRGNKSSIVKGGGGIQGGGATIEENAYPLVDEVYAKIAEKVKEAKEDAEKYNDEY